MKLVKNSCLRLTALGRRHASSSSTAAAATAVDCDGGVGTRSDVKHLLTEKPSHNASLRHFNYRLHSLLGSASPGRYYAALSILRGMLSPESTSPPDAATRSIVFSGLAKRSQPPNEEFLALLVEMAKMGFFPPDAFLFTQLIDKLCRGGATSGAWDFFHAVKDAGGSIQPPVCNALLTGLAAIRDFSRMNLLFSEMKVLGVRPSAVTFGILINHLCKSRRLNDALNVFDAMSSPDSEVSPSTITFNTIIDGLCKAGRLQDGLSLLDSMKSSHSCDPDSATYNCLIDAFCKAAEFDRAHELLTRMEKERVAVDVVTLTSFVNGMCKHGMIGSALDFFRKKKVEWPEVKGDAITYSTMIGSFLRSNNAGRAVALFDEMIKEGVSPDSITFLTLISGLAQIGKLDAAYTYVSLMIKNGFRADTKLYTTLISGFCKKKRMDKAFEIYDEMCTAGLRPDIFTYTTLIDAFCKAGDFSKADKFLKEMIDDGYKPNVVTYGTLIDGCCKAGDFSKADKLLKEMVEDGCKPDVVTYGTLINGYCKAGELELAMKIFSSMDVSVVPADTVIYNILIDSYFKNNKVDAAIDLFHEMQKQGILPNVITYNCIFMGLRDHNMSDKAFDLMDKMSSQGCKPNYVTMDVLTVWLTTIGEMERLRLFVQRTTSSDINSGNPDVNL